MSCRILSGDAAGAAPAMEWQRVAPPAGSCLSGNLYFDPVHRGSPPEEGTVEPDEAARIHEAHEAGVRQGEAAATERSARALHAQLEKLSLSIEQLAGYRSRIRREEEPELVRLAIAIARRILRRELTVDPESLLGLIKAGLQKMDASEVHRVRVHPHHAAIMIRLLDGAALRIEVTGDPRLEEGAVIFETTRGTLDASLDTQLREIERGFADIYPVAGADSK